MRQSIPAVVNLDTLSPASDTSPLKSAITVGDINVAMLVDTLATKENTAGVIAGGILEATENRL